MRTYVEVEGEGIESIIQELANITIDTPEICVWDPHIRDVIFKGEELGVLTNYFGMSLDDFEEKCDDIIAKFGEELRDNIMYFEWKSQPSNEQLKILRKKIDDVMIVFKNKYTVTNK